MNMVPDDIIPDEVTELLLLLLKLRHQDVGQVLANKELHSCALRFASVVAPIPTKVRGNATSILPSPTLHSPALTPVPRHSRYRWRSCLPASRLPCEATRMKRRP